MTISIDENNTIRIFKGDYGEIVVENLEPDKNYFIYFAVTDEDGKQIGQVEQTSNGQEQITIRLFPVFTDALNVPSGEKFQTYYYAVKTLEVGTKEENTRIPALGGKAVLIVFQKEAEGEQ